MKSRDPSLHVQPAPFLDSPVSTPAIMNTVSLALAPVLCAAVWYFGFGALLVVLAAVAGCMVTEWAFPRPRTRRGASLRDGSAILTGVLLGLTLPPSMPLWMAFLGGVVAIGLGKVVWGGLGQNLFNPALVGRAFLQAAFPQAITTWTDPGAGASSALSSGAFAVPLTTPQVDAISGATPLAEMKFEHTAPDFLDTLWGSTGGSLGETSALIIILCGLFLAYRRAFDWRIPVAILVTAAVFAGILHGIRPDEWPAPQYMLTSGGLLFGAVFMATDPVTSPMSPRGAWIFGAGIGFLVILIRLFGGLPEGVMYAILLMNAGSPLIDRVTQPTPFGREAS